MNKNYKIFGVRQSLLGDSIGALPVLNHLEKILPGSFKYWHLAQKCSHLAPLLIGHNLIDKVVFSDCNEGFGPADYELMKQSDLVINTMPQHPAEFDWPNYRNFYEETFWMSSFPLSDYQALSEEEKYPKLERWFRPEPRLSNNKYVSIWGFAGYSRDLYRSPSPKWYGELIDRLKKHGIDSVQYGHPNDPELEGVAARRNDIDFFQQIRETLSSDTVLSTDSGSGLIFAAYGMRQVGLINVHWPGQHRNPLALAPIGKNTFNFSGKADSISLDEVTAKVLELVK